ncbi:MAG: glycosyltransferase family 4 protein [Bacteroidia bacterium]
MKILFLYTEIADYFLSGCIALINKNVEVHVVRWKINSEAPFQFLFPERLTVYERDNYSTQDLLNLTKKIAPDIIVCSGWLDKGYLQVCKQFKKKAVTILTLDNHWRGDLKQRIATLISPFYLHTRFTKCWVPGTLQFGYALKLGFKKTNILQGFYTCNYTLFHDEYLANKEEKKQHFPKRFIYVGRYVKHKGIEDLWQAFMALEKEKTTEWELWCIGNGDLKPIIHPKIKHLGFIQPNELKKYIKDTGVFILPSHFEPWGVVVHEFAAAGFPIICTDEVGARTAFVEHQVNGFIYKAGAIDELKEQLKKIINLNNDQLFKMAEKSVEKAKQITPDIWASQLMEIIP